MKRLINYIFLSFLLFSCENQYCSRFNTKVLPFNYKKFKSSIQYTNTFDTLTLFLTDEFISGGYNVPNAFTQILGDAPSSCESYLELKFKDKDDKISILYTFSAISKDSMELNVRVNFSDVTLKYKFEKNKKYLDTLSADLNSVYNVSKYHIIKQLILENFRVKSFEFYSGEKWYLIKDGDSLVNQKISKPKQLKSLII
jgi:hypothetical protein